MTSADLKIGSLYRPNWAKQDLLVYSHHFGSGPYTFFRPHALHKPLRLAEKYLADMEPHEPVAGTVYLIKGGRAALVRTTPFYRWSMKAATTEVPVHSSRIRGLGAFQPGDAVVRRKDAAGRVLQLKEFIGFSSPKGTRWRLSDGSTALERDLRVVAQASEAPVPAAADTGRFVVGNVYTYKNYYRVFIGENTSTGYMKFRYMELPPNREAQACRRGYAERHYQPHRFQPGMAVRHAFREGVVLQAPKKVLAETRTLYWTATEAGGRTVEVGEEFLEGGGGSRFQTVAAVTGVAAAAFPAMPAAAISLQGVPVPSAYNRDLALARVRLLDARHALERAYEALTGNPGADEAAVVTAAESQLAKAPPLLADVARLLQIGRPDRQKKAGPPRS